MIKLKKAPTPKWMLPRIFMNLSMIGAYPVCRQDRHFYYLRLFLLSRKVSNATMNILTATIKEAVPRIVETISYAVIGTPSLPMYSGNPVISSGGSHPVMGTFFKRILAQQVLYFNLFIFCDRDNVKGVLRRIPTCQH